MLGLGSGIVYGGAPSEFSLSDIVGLKAWYQFKTGILTSGTDVTDWTDSSGNTSENMDLRRSGTVEYVPGSGAVRFNDANNSIMHTASDQLNLSTFTIFGVVDIVEAGATNEAVIGRAGNDEFRLFRGANNKNVRLRANGVNYDLTMTNALPTGIFLFTIIRNAAGQFTIRIDGSEEGAVSTDIADLFDFTRIGNGATDSSVFEIAIYNKELNSTDISTIEADINSRVGL